jgi:hypothetical protein
LRKRIQSKNLPKSRKVAWWWKKASGIMGSKWKCNNSPCSIQSIPTNTFAPVYNSVIPELAAGRKPLSGMCTYQRGVLSFGDPSADRQATPASAGGERADAQYGFGS